MPQSHTHVHHANTPCSPQDVDAFLNEAETLVARRGQRMTRIRRKVLRLLLESHAPAKAYDLLGNLDGEGSAKPPTIYRALDFLQETGLAHKIDPGPETTGNGYDDERASDMPRDWHAEIAAATASEFLKEALGADMHRTFCAVKAAEYARVARTISNVDYDLYLHSV